jgi:hypothetical protein
LATVSPPAATLIEVSQLYGPHFSSMSPPLLRVERSHAANSTKAFESSMIPL